MCNGHADKCTQTDSGLMACHCQHNTCGEQCQRCCDGYVQNDGVCAGKLLEFRRVSLQLFHLVEIGCRVIVTVTVTGEGDGDGDGDSNSNFFSKLKWSAASKAILGEGRVTTSFVQKTMSFYCGKPNNALR